MTVQTSRLNQLFLNKRVLRMALVTLAVVVGLVGGYAVMYAAEDANCAGGSAAPGFVVECFETNSGHIVESSPVIADLNGDGVMEVFFATTNQGASGRTQTPKVVAVNSSGAIVFQATLDAPTNSSPSIADIDNDGDMEILIGVGSVVEDSAKPGGMMAFDHTGKKLWKYSTLNWDNNPAGATKEVGGDGVWGTPALCDLDGDKDIEIVFASWDQHIYVLDHTGKSLWNNLPVGFPTDGYHNADSVWSSAACADFNDDGYQEIVIGADISPGGTLPDGWVSKCGGFIYVFDHMGHVLVRRDLPEAIFSSPAIGDLDNNGTLEIVIGSGRFWWENWNKPPGRCPSQAPKEVYAFSSAELFSGKAYDDNSKLPYLPGWPQQTNYPGFSSPALADLDGDNDLEIVIGTGDPFLNTGDNLNGAGQVYAFQHNGSVMPGWPVTPVNFGGDNSMVSSTPVIADIDNDGTNEILFTMAWDVHVYNPSGVREHRLGTTFTVGGSPAVGDTDNDGKIEVWAGSSNNFDTTQGFAWRFEREATGFGAMPWPLFRQNALGQGLYARPAGLAASTTNLKIMHDNAAGSTARGSFVLRNTGDKATTWSVTSKPGSVTVTPSTGTLNGHGSVTMTISVSIGGLPVGDNSIGNVQIGLGAPRTTAAPDANTVTVAVNVRNASLLSLPMVNYGASEGVSGTSRSDLIYWTYRWNRLNGGHVQFSSPTIADLNGDGKDEILVGSSKYTQSGTTTPYIHVLNNDGTVLWERAVANSVAASPSVGNLDDAGQPEVVVAFGGDNRQNAPGAVIAYSSVGTQLWAFAPRNNMGVFSTPALCDLTGDGTLETIFGARDGYVYALNSAGGKIWEYNMNWETFSSPACADFNNDGFKEVVIGTRWRPGGRLLVFHADGRLMVDHAMPEGVDSSPVIADLDGNGSKEIIVGTGTEFWRIGDHGPITQLFVFDTQNIFAGTLQNRAGWPASTDYPVKAAPAVADLDGDGKLDVIAVTTSQSVKQPTDDSISGAGSIYAWNHQGNPMPGWPKLRPKAIDGQDAPLEWAPVVADLDVDGKAEVIVSILNSILIFNGDGSVQPYPTATKYSGNSSPAVGDTDNDGKIEIWIGSSYNVDNISPNNPERGYIWWFESDFTGYGAMNWPTRRGNAQNTGAR